MKLLLIGLLLYSMSLPSQATMVDTEIMDCPACGHGYEKTVIISWNYMMSGGKDPEPPSAMCPHCLFSWQSKVPKLTDEARSRQLSGLHFLRDSLSASQKRRLFITPEIYIGDGEDRLLRHSRWILTGKRPLGRMKWPESKSKISQSAKSQRSKAIELMKRMETGASLSKDELVTLRKEITRISIGYIEDFLSKGDRQMQVFTISWLLWTTDRDLTDSQYCLTDIAILLKAIPNTEWPDIPNSKGTHPAIMASFDYLRGNAPWPKEFDKALRSRNNFGVKSWIVACAAARQDRKLVPWFAKQLHIESSWQMAEMVPDYLFCVGKIEDLQMLEKAHDRWVRVERKRTTSWETSSAFLSDLEESMLSLRLKLVFLTPSGQQPDPRIIRKRR